MECPWRGKDRCGRFRTRRCSSRGAQSPSDRFPDSARVCGCRHFATRREFNTGSLLLKSPAVLRARSLQKLSVPLVVGGVVILVLDAGRRLFRRAQLFCPSRDPILTWNPEDYGLPRERSEEVWIESPDGQMLHGWYCRAENPIASGLYCHGNTGNMTTTAHAMPRLLESGIN